MAYILKLLIFALACIVTASLAHGRTQTPELRVQSEIQDEQHNHHDHHHIDHDEPHEHEKRVRRQSNTVYAKEEGKDVLNRKATIPCDLTLVPKISCYDCYTRLSCKTKGGKLSPCNNILKPYCYNGECSAIASPECRI